VVEINVSSDPVRTIDITDAEELKARSGACPVHLLPLRSGCCKSCSNSVLSRSDLQDVTHVLVRVMKLFSTVQMVPLR
jgi:hypothetical protein